MREDASKVIAVTGATSGMGKACVEELSAAGHRVYGTVFGMEMDPEWSALPYTLIPCDITDQEEVAAFYARIEEGAKRIDVLVNCAGFALCCPSCVSRGAAESSPSAPSPDRFRPYRFRASTA
jgi:NAD(P)-dependent dehydrogenase (short-subunit alcohol dehydrogenase family)